MAEANEIRTHIKANIKMMAIKAIITRVIEDFFITHVETFLRVIAMTILEEEAMAKAEAIIMAVIEVGLIIEVMLIINTISIMAMMMSTRQTNMVHHVYYVVDIITPLNIVSRESMTSMILWKRLILMAINHNQVVYIPKGEHEDSHELPQQQDLEGSTKIENTLYSHADTMISSPNSLQKLDYIYQHFQDNEKIHELDTKAVSFETDNTLYPHINNDIEYGLFKDIIDSYYLDSQIKDDFTCNQNCHTKTQYKQQDQTMTLCTHAYDHITQHIDNLEDPTQQHTVYTNEVDASLFTTDTNTSCDYNIMTSIPNSNKPQEIKINATQPMGIHSQSKHKYRNIFCDSNIQYHDFDNGDALNFKDKYTMLLQQELQNPYWCFHDPIATKSYHISTEMDIETIATCHVFFRQ